MENEKSISTIRQLMKTDLLKGREISSLTAVHVYNTVDARKCLSDLRLDYGMDISFKWLQNENTGKRYKVHYMTPESIAKYYESHKDTNQDD